MTTHFTLDLPTLRSALTGRLLLPTDPGYDQTRQIWNGMIDRRPALIVQCAGVDDVRLALGFAREHGLEIADRDFVASALESISVWTVTRHAPPLPFLPAEAHGRKVVVLAIAATAPEEAGEAAIAPLLALGDPLGTHIGTMPYLHWQQAFDPLPTPGARNYWKSHNFTALDDRVLDAIVAFGERLPLPECELFAAHVGGAPNRVAPEASAYGHRDARFVMNVHGCWQRPDDDAACIAWAREVSSACAPFASGGAYTNFMTADEAGRIEAAYGANHARLRGIEHRYDPDNVFHLNQNILPLAA